MNETVLELNNIEKDYGSAHVLGPLSLEIHSGDMIGIRGENGSGKSTLLRLMAGLEKVSSGSIKHTDFMPGELGYVPQQIALFPTFTGYQNLRFFAAAIGLKGKELKQRSRCLLRAVGLEEKAKSKVSTYSGGMQRRLNLACALLRPPKLLLADEPTVGADDRSIELILDILKELSVNGCAVVLITHHKDEYRKLDCSLYCLKNGLLIKETE